MYMKNKILGYVLGITLVFSLQSCVSNYVVSNPQTLAKEYKSDAKQASIDIQKYEEAKQQLLSSFHQTKAIALEKEDLAKSLETKNKEIADNKYKGFINTILEEAKTYLGTPYRYGGSTRKGIDCSAFVLSVFGAVAGLKLPRVAASQALEGEKIEKENLKKGDLIFFSKGKGRISHVGIVYNVDEGGNIQFIHASTSQGVTITTLQESSYWNPKFRFAKRVIEKEDVDSLQQMVMNQN